MRFQAQGLSRFFRLFQQVGRRFTQDDCFNLAASLTYTTLLALVPLVTIGLAIFSAFPAFKQFTVGVNEFIAQTMLPAAVGQIVQTHLEEFTRSAGKLTALGFTVLTITAVLLMQTIDGALQRIFRVRRRRPLGLRVLVYWGVLTLGPLLIGASLSLSSYFMRASMSVAQRYDAVRALDLIPLALTVVAFTLLYYIVPNRRVLFRHALLGGFGAAILFEVMKRVFAYYIAQFPTYTLIYGAFAAIPIFLLWIYLSWLVTLLGAVFAAALPNWNAFGKANAFRSRTPLGEALDQVLRILRALVNAHRQSRVLTTGQIAGRLGILIEDAEHILDELARGGWVARAVGERWSLACDAHTTTVAEVCDGFLFGALEPASPLEEVRLSTMKLLSVPLTSLADGPRSQPAPVSQTPLRRQR